jgi:hypothetical protein
MIDLPAGQTLEGWHAVSVWCVAAGVSFGSGTFTSTPPIAGDYSANGMVDAADYTVWRSSHGQIGDDLAADGTGPAGTPDGLIDQLDYDYWKTHFGTDSGGVGASSRSLSNMTVPEPAVWMLLVSGIFTALSHRQRRQRAVTLQATNLIQSSDHPGAARMMGRPQNSMDA